MNLLAQRNLFHETLVQMDDGHELPLGLRVDALVVCNDSALKQE